MAMEWELQTAAGVAGAIAVVQVRAGDGAELEGALVSLGLAPVAVGRIVLRDLLGVDRGVVARWDERSVHLMPHGGVAVVRELVRALAERGVLETRSTALESGATGVRAIYPEAASLLEARMLAALARAASPLAVDLLLEQARRWPRELHDVDDPPPAPAGEAAGELSRLIEPALVVALGPANVGKSSLVNALAGRGVALVADEPGTTRDHVGVMLDLAGVVVRYVDTPGVRRGGGAIEREALELAAEVARRADLVLLCGDAGAGPLGPPSKAPVLRVGLRADLGEAAWADVSVSVKQGRGVRELVARARDALVPPAALADGRPWRFWAV